MALSNRARGRGFTPLRITARLRCGVISDGYLTLDGALYAAAHREALAPQVATYSRASAVTGESRATRLPIMRIAIPKMAAQWTPDFYYAASVAQWPAQVAEGVDHWTKKIDSKYIDLLEHQRARVPTSGGTYRAYRMPVAYRHALRVIWYVVGEPVEIRRLLTMVTHLGKKTSQGWGCVAKWMVESHDEDWSVTGPDGRLMRPVPQEGGLPCGIVPPYWLPRHQIPCRLPTLT